MPSIEADPDKLKQLAKEFQACADEVEQQTRRLQRALDRTEWAGQERQRFEESLRPSLRALTVAAQEFRTRFPAELRRKAAALDQFRS